MWGKGKFLRGSALSRITLDVIDDAVLRHIIGGSTGSSWTTGGGTTSTYNSKGTLTATGSNPNTSFEPYTPPSPPGQPTNSNWNGTVSANSIANPLVSVSGGDSVGTSTNLGHGVSVTTSAGSSLLAVGEGGVIPAAGSGLPPSLVGASGSVSVSNSASVGINIGNVESISATVTAGEGAQGGVGLTVGNGGLTVGASGSAQAGMTITLSQTTQGNIGEGVNASQTSSVTVTSGDSAEGTAEFSLNKNATIVISEGVWSGTAAGASETVSVSKAGFASVVSAGVVSPGAVGESLSPSYSQANGTLTLGLSGGIAIEIGGIQVGATVSIPYSAIGQALETSFNYIVQNFIPGGEAGLAAAEQAGQTEWNNITSGANGAYYTVASGIQTAENWVNSIHI